MIPYIYLNTVLEVKLRGEFNELIELLFQQTNQMPVLIK